MRRPSSISEIRDCVSPWPAATAASFCVRSPRTVRHHSGNVMTTPHPRTGYQGPDGGATTKWIPPCASLPLMTDLGKQLRDMRKAAGLKGGEVGARAGKSQRWVSYLETGRTEATVAECKAFAEACGFDARLITGRPGSGMDLVAAAEGRPDADLKMAADLLRLLPS